LFDNSSRKSLDIWAIFSDCNQSWAGRVIGRCVGDVCLPPSWPGQFQSCTKEKWNLPFLKMGCSLTHKSRWRPIFSQRLHFERSVVVPNHIVNAYNYQINKVLVFKFYLIYYIQM
jgi:hypothetical protein